MTIEEIKNNIISILEKNFIRTNTLSEATLINALSRDIRTLIAEEVEKGIKEFAQNIDKDLMFPIERKYKLEIEDLADRYIQKYLKS